MASAREKGVPYEKQYYIVVSTPIGDGSGFWQAADFVTTHLHKALQVEHRFLLGPNKQNFGRDREGAAADVHPSRKLRVEDRTKYNAKYIEAAVKVVKNKELKADGAHPDALDLMGIDANEAPEFPVYGGANKNCHHYVDEVIEEADKLAVKDGQPLIIP